MKKVFFKISWLISLVVLSGCGNSGSPVPSPTVTVYVPAPNPGFNSENNFNQNDVQEQLDAARQVACNAAQEIQRQWIQLDNQLNEMESNSWNRNESSFDFPNQTQALRLQVHQLRQQESNLRQQCNG